MWFQVNKLIPCFVFFLKGSWRSSSRQFHVVDSTETKTLCACFDTARTFWPISAEQMVTLFGADVLCLFTAASLASSASQRAQASSSSITGRRRSHTVPQLFHNTFISLSQIQCHQRHYLSYFFSTRLWLGWCLGRGKWKKGRNMWWKWTSWEKGRKHVLFYESFFFKHTHRLSAYTVTTECQTMETEIDMFLQWLAHKHPSLQSHLGRLVLPGAPCSCLAQGNKFNLISAENNQQLLTDRLPTNVQRCFSKHVVWLETNVKYPGTAGLLTANEITFQ